MMTYARPSQENAPSSDQDLQRTREFRSLDDLIDMDTLNQFRLQIQGPGLAGELDLAPVLIGRDPSCQIVLRDEAISRFHCVIHRAGRQTVIRDLHSTNGVYLNQVKVFHAPLRVGDSFQVGSHRFDVRLGGQRRQTYASEAAVMFMDTADSTRLNETHGPVFSQAVHQALSHIEDQIFWQQGCPLKHTGDGLMGAFGIWPELDGAPADAALRAALQAVQQISSMPGFPGTRLRVGLAWGDVSVRQQDFLDLFGDTVSLASRMENSNKHYDTSIMMSESFFKQLKFRHGIREVDTVRVQGKSRPVRLYTWDERLAGSRDILYTGFYHLGLEHYRSGHFETAYGYFERAAAQGDALSAMMQSRIESLLAGEPPETWDGVWTLDKV